MPKQSDILGVPVDDQAEEESPQEYSTEDWINYIWDLQIGAVPNPNVQCWTCGQWGHLGRNCPSKGKGKGGGKNGSKGGGKAGGKGDSKGKGK
eukprot:6429404-Karenia_brevis.AAC.1